MSTWTLQYNGTEQSAAAWGFTADPVLRLRTQAAAQFTFTMAGADPAGTPPFPFEAPVIIRQNRVLSGGGYINDGSSNHFVFQGRLTNPKGSVSGQRQDVKMVFQDPWYDLENIPFQQLWQIPGGTAYFARCYLFYNAATTPPGYLTVAQQLTDIITYAASAGANLQPGTIQGPSQMPWYAVRGLNCAAAIKKCLELFPDLITWIDGSTTPPSFNCVSRASLAAVTLPYKGVDTHGRAHKGSDLTPRHDLVPSQVVLQYQQTISSGGTSGVQLITDAWPVGATGEALRALVCPIDLRGSSASFTKTQLVTQAFDPTDVVNFWQTHVKTLKDADITATPVLVDDSVNSGSAYGVTVLDSSGNPVNFAALYPVEMIRPSKWAAWTGVNIIEVTVSGYLNYTKAKKIGTGGARLTDQFPAQLHTVRLKLCNAPPGTTNYQTENAYDSGENPVTGLAHYLYDSLNQLQFDGSHEIQEQNGVWQVIGPWNVLNLTGGASAWATMNASIPEAEINFFTNTTRLTLGPARHLAPQDLNTYFQFFRQRIMWDNAQLRSGTVTGGAVDESGDMVGDDANSAHPQQGLKEFRAPDATTGAYTNAITLDPGNGQLEIQQFDATGSPVPAAGAITAQLGDLADASNKAASFQWVSFCDSSGNQMRAKVLCTTPEAA